MAKKKSKRKIRKCNDLFREIQLQDSDETWSVSDWDLWFLVVLLNEFNGEWQALIDYFRQDIGRSYGRYEGRI